MILWGILSIVTLLPRPSTILPGGDCGTQPRQIRIDKAAMTKKYFRVCLIIVITSKSISKQNPPAYEAGGLIQK
jgi:hypothetical protein